MGDECLISSVEYEEDSIKPVILSFENGKLQPGHERNLVCRMYTDQKKQLTVTAATENMIYNGQIKHDELFNTFIAIRDKDTNEMSLVAVDYAILSPLFKQQDLLNVSTATTEFTTSELNKQFGSKRVKRRTEQRERMKMDIENVKEQLEQTVADIKVDVQEIVTPNADETDSGYKPPINRDADRIEDVYSLDELISPNVLESVSEEATRVLETEEEDSFGTSVFVTQQIKRLRNLPEKEDTCQLFLYIDCLIKFMNVQAKLVSSKKYKACSYSDAVHNEIMNKFTIASRTGRLRPPVMRDKCMCYILVFSMIACDYKINLEILAKELKSGVKKLQEVSRILAFHVNKETAVLSLPLPAPVSTVRKGKKRKQF